MDELLPPTLLDVISVEIKNNLHFSIFHPTHSLPPDWSQYHRNPCCDIPCSSVGDPAHPGAWCRVCLAEILLPAHLQGRQAVGGNLQVSSLLSALHFTAR